MKTTFKKGGIHPPENKYTKGYPIEEMPIPPKVFVSLSQHLGKPAQPVVKKGDLVLKGQLIGKADGFISANIHAPTSGKILSIGNMPHIGGQYAPSITIESDGEDKWADGVNVENKNYQNFSKDEILKKIQEAGIVGMGGAGFPSNVKLNPPPSKTIDTIILNGAECEPFLTADYRLMLEHTDIILNGMKIVSSLFDKETKKYIAIEDNKPDVIEKFENILKTNNPDNFKVISLYTKYPQGGEKQLINAITNRTVKEGQLPFDVGCLVHNAATFAAIYEAVVFNKPLIERILTVSGLAIDTGKNIKAVIGTKIQDIIDFCGGTKASLNQVIAGGPMMGKSQYTFDVSTTKTTSGLLFIDNKELKEPHDRPCIRCGKCFEICPQGIFAAELANRCQQGLFDSLPGIGLLNCMECGSCAYSCPSKRDLVHWIKYGKAHYAQLKRLKAMQQKSAEK